MDTSDFKNYAHSISWLTNAINDIDRQQEEMSRILDNRLRELAQAVDTAIDHTNMAYEWLERQTQRREFDIDSQRAFEKIGQAYGILKEANENLKESAKALESDLQARMKSVKSHAEELLEVIKEATGI